MHARVSQSVPALAQTVKSKERQKSGAVWQRSRSVLAFVRSRVTTTPPARAASFKIHYAFFVGYDAGDRLWDKPDELRVIEVRRAGARCASRLISTAPAPAPAHAGRLPAHRGWLPHRAEGEQLRERASGPVRDRHHASTSAWRAWLEHPCGFGTH